MSQLQWNPVNAAPCCTWPLSVSDSLWPHGYSPAGSSVRGILQTKILEWVAMPSSRGSSQPRDWTQVFRITGKLFISWVAREPKNTVVGSLSLLLGIFPTQESNWGLLHCMQILYQLIYQGNPIIGQPIVSFASNYSLFIFKPNESVNKIWISKG